ncbi:MAG: hypothetical protein F4239_06930, partial [Gammaproteobacteria bacterium]|nr:hypothetical protein [Gammaproteobacteria bacterium]
MNRRPSIFIVSVMTLVLLLIATTQVQAQTMEPTLPNGCSTNSPTQNWINSVTSTPTSITVTLNDPPRPEGALIVICSPNDSNIYSENTIFTLFTPAAGSHTIHRIGWNQPTNAPPVKPATDYWVRIRDGTGYGGNYSEWYYIRTKAVSLTLNSAGADNTYQSGDEIEVTATFTESVTVTGSPRIPFTLGQETLHAVYDSGSPGTALEFSYTVVAGDLDTDGIEIAANALENHGGSTINLTSDSSVAAALEHGAVTASANHKVDGGAVTTPTVPEFANDTMTLEVAENTASGSNVGTAVTAVDRDRDTLTYSLSGTDAGSFDIDSANGQITVGSGTVLDYETTTSYSVTVGVTDGKNDNGDDESSPTVDATIVVEISVTNVEEPPEVPTNVTVTGASSSSLAVSWTAPSNQGARLDGYDVRYFQGTSSPSAESQWIDHAHSGTGTSTTISGLAANTAYQVQVRAKGDGNSAWVFASGVTERLPAPPEFANDNVTLAVVENTAAGSDVGVPVTASDVNGDTLTYSLSGTDAGSFDIDSASGQIKVGSGTALNYEAKNSYSVTVEVTDSEDENGNTQDPPTVDDTVAVVINVTNIEEPPGLPTNVTVTAVSKSSVSVSWTAPSDHGARLSGYDVRYYQGTSAPTDESQWINHAHSDTGTSTTISGLSANTDYQVQVRATGDGAGDWVTASGVTEALPTVPEFASDSAVRTVAENLASGSSVGAVVVATDSDRDTLTYSLSGTDAGSFNIDSATGQITVGSGTVLNFETKSRYSVTVGVTDGEDENGDTQVSPTIDDTIAVRIQLIDVNEEPEFSDGARTTRSVAENSPAGTLIGEPVAATDVDRGDRLTYTLSGTDRAAFTINSDNGQLAVAPNTTLDFETTPTLVVTVTATDAAGASVGITVVINLTDKSEPPKVPSGVTQRNTTDSSLTVLWDAPGRGDPPVVSYLLQYRVSGSGNQWTDINTTFTSVNLTGLKDDFNYRVRVLATNADGASGWSEKIVKTFPSSSPCSYPHQQVDLKTPPTSVAATYKSITVEAAIKSFAQFYLCKPDALGNYTRSSTPDIRANGQYKHTFTDVTAGSRHWVGGVTFAENGFSTLTIEWTAVDVPNNEPPVFDSLDGVRSVAENSPADTNIGAAFTATDPEGDTLQWTLGGTDAEYFLIEVNENEAQLKLAEDAKLDYETRRSYRLTLAVSDGLNHDAEADTTPDASLPITVTVTDVIEKPLAPTILRTAGQSAGGLLIRWSAPDNTGRPPIVDYDLQYRDAGTTNTFVDARYD